MWRARPGMRRREQVALRQRQRLAAAEARAAELAAAVAARDAFIAVAAHELRNPMLPLVLQIDALRTAVRRGDLSSVEAGLERPDRLAAQFVRRADTLLDVSRLNSGQFRLDPAWLDLSAAVRAVVQGFEAAAARAGCALEVRIADGLSGWLDRTAVQQIVENLVSNALKFGAGQPVRVILDGNGDAAVLTVGDHGPGIAPGDQARIFAPFARAGGSRDQGGFGVGLWVVEQLVHGMGGRIALTSAIGHGATFAVTLPLART